MPSPTPLVSIITAAYNCNAFIAKTIMSVIAQTYPHWELLLVDDASTDDTHAVLSQWAHHDRRIRVFTNSRNEGTARSRNIALHHAQGSLIAVLDHDDVWLDPRKLERQVRYFAERPGLAVLGTWAVVVNENGREIARWRKSTDDHSIRMRMLGANQFIHSSVMFSAALLQKAGYYDPTFRYAEDFDFLLRLGRHGTLENLPEFMTSFLVSPRNIRLRKRQAQLQETLTSILRHRRDYPGFLKAVCITTIRLLLNAVLLRPRY